MEDRQVSLKQVLDTVDEMPVMKDNNGMEFIMKSLAKMRIGLLRLLPSAQPSFSQPHENDHIADDSKMVAQSEPCEYYAICRHGRDENKLRARLGVCEYCNEDADGYVKPIEKNGHAFIRFGMNGWELDLKANGWHGSAKIRYCPVCGRDLLVK